MRSPSRPSRREFVHSGVAGTALLLGGAAARAGKEAAKLPQRPLGKTGVNVSILGLGTVALGSLPDRKEAEALVNRAIDLGVTYVDAAPPRTSRASMTG